MGSQFEWVKGGGQIPLTLSVQHNLVPVSGLSPTVQVVRYPDSKVADWSTNTFVDENSASSGFGVMTEISSGTAVYVRNFNPDLFVDEASGRQIYHARYKAVIPSGFNSLPADLPVEDIDVIFFRPNNNELFASFV